MCLLKSKWEHKAGFVVAWTFFTSMYNLMFSTALPTRSLGLYVYVLAFFPGICDVHNTVYSLCFIVFCVHKESPNVFSLKIIIIQIWQWPSQAWCQKLFLYLVWWSTFTKSFIAAVTSESQYSWNTATLFPKIGTNKHGNSLFYYLKLCGRSLYTKI